MSAEDDYNEYTTDDKSNSPNAVQIVTLVTVLLILVIALGWTLVASRQIIALKQIWPQVV